MQHAAGGCDAILLDSREQVLSIAINYYYQQYVGVGKRRAWKYITSQIQHARGRGSTTRLRHLEALYVRGRIGGFKVSP